MENPCTRRVGGRRHGLWPSRWRKPAIAGTDVAPMPYLGGESPSSADLWKLEGGREEGGCSYQMTSESA